MCVIVLVCFVLCVVVLGVCVCVFVSVVCWLNALLIVDVGCALISCVLCVFALLCVFWFSYGHVG